jgi:hypothetical protein
MTVKGRSPDEIENVGGREKSAVPPGFFGSSWEPLQNLDLDNRSAKADRFD